MTLRARPIVDLAQAPAAQERIQTRARLAIVAIRRRRGKPGDDDGGVGEGVRATGRPFQAGQRLAARHHYRPALPETVPEAARAHFVALPQVGIDAQFGGWAKAHARHFADGGTFDQIHALR